MPTFLLCLVLFVPLTAQLIQTPDTEAQRTAMKKLSFLIGKWSGEARILRSTGEPLELIQTEEAEYKLNGLLLMIEGIGRSRSDGKPALQALGIISYDDLAGTYRMRAFNDGRYMETEVKLVPDGKGLTWSFTMGEIKTSSVLRIDEKGDWTELHDIVIGSQTPRKFMELRVSPQK